MPVDNTELTKLLAEMKRVHVAGEREGYNEAHNSDFGQKECTNIIKNSGIAALNEKIEQLKEFKTRQNKAQEFFEWCLPLRIEDRTIREVHHLEDYPNIGLEDDKKENIRVTAKQECKSVGEEASWSEESWEQQKNKIIKSLQEAKNAYS